MGKIAIRQRQDVVDGFTGTHGKRTDEDGLATGRFDIALIEIAGNVGDPLLFFGTVGEDKLQGARRCAFAGSALLPGRILLLAPAEDETG